MSSIQHFLLVFDHDKGELIENMKFGGDADKAVAAYSQKEKDCQKNSSLEIVLIGSDSWDTVKLTHANYFSGEAARSKYLAGV
ncbi:MAG: hypothetical protein ACYDC5_10560 [Candidatus Dormibacteria bacterium]